VKLILRAVPPAWVEGLAEVRLSNSLEYYRPLCIFSRYDGGLTIYSRRGTKKQAWWRFCLRWRRPHLTSELESGDDIQNRTGAASINIIQPFVDELMPEIAPGPKRGWWGQPCSCIT
jgi:hypothetical protein